MTDEQATHSTDVDSLLNQIPGHLFDHAATGFGVEIYGGTPEERRAVFEARFDDPTITVDGRNVNSQDEFVRAVLGKARRLTGRPTRRVASAGSTPSGTCRRLAQIWFY